MLDMAAFVNATTARYVEANDVYARCKLGYMHGHPSDVIMPLLGVAEHTRASGRELLLSVVLAYEIYLGRYDASRSGGFDPAGFEGQPQSDRARVTLAQHAGARRVGEAGGDTHDLAMPKSDARIEQKFRSMTCGVLDEARRVEILRRLWRFETAAEVAWVPSAFVIESI